ncbi:MAG: glycosyltransferase [Promethearchaeota archaeon]
MFIFALVMLYHLLIYFFKDKKYIKIAKNFKDPKKVTINDLKSYPLVNFIIPAWNKGKTFEDCLISITKLNYPNIKIIINAGGSDETLKIANSFKESHNFIVLKQEKGIYLIQGHNKIRALNQCFDYISEGLLFLLDADCYITDEILLRMIYPIINDGEDLVCAGVRPLKSQESIDIVKYVHISRFDLINHKFTRYTYGGITGANTCLTYNVLKKIGKFSENGLIIEEHSRGKDLANHGFSSYNLTNYRSWMYTEYPANLKELYSQRKRFIRYKFLFSLQIKKMKPIISILIIFAISLYVFILPILFFMHLGLFILGILFLLSSYLKKIRKYLAFKNFLDSEYYYKFQLKFFLKLIIYIYIEMIFNIKIMIGLIPFILKYKRHKIEKFN